MFVFKAIANKLTKSKLNSYTSTVLGYEFVKEWILNDIQERLYNKGETATGSDLQTDRAKMQASDTYSRYTKFLKNQKNQKIDNITLNDSGAFYNSFKVNVNKTFYSIYANFDKKGSNIYDNFKTSFNNFDEFKSEILNMSDKSLRIFYDKIFLPEFNAIIINELKDV